MSNFHQPICIVGAGCVLPQADNVEEFWQRVEEGTTQVKELSEDRWASDHLLDKKNKAAKDRAYSKMGAEISYDKLKELAKKFDMDSGEYNPVDIITLEAIEQATQNLSLPVDKTHLILGMMNPDEPYYAAHFQRANQEMLDFACKYEGADKELIEKTIEEKFAEVFRDWQAGPQNFVTTSLFNVLEERLGFKNSPSVFVDAACASSLAAIDLAIDRLVKGEAEVVLAGGVEKNLSFGAYVLFSKVGALAPEVCLPFDLTSQGLSQGEGAVVFALMRLDRALEQNCEILGVLQACEGGSDGVAGSLFQPVKEGQSRVLRRAYSQLAQARVDYIEAHATGTQVGDSTEMRALSEFFGDFKIPLGSVKHIFGHTKGAAGATSLLKCLMILKHKSIPPTTYMNHPVDPGIGHLFFNDKNLKMRKSPTPLRCGVSSLGFGGINYHAVVEEYKSDFDYNCPREFHDIDVLQAGEVSLDMQAVTDEYIRSELNIPPRSLPQIDRTQLVGAVAVGKLFAKLGLIIHSGNKEQISVISSCSLGLDHLAYLSKRIFHEWLVEELIAEEKLDPHFLRYFRRFKYNFPEVTEDSGPGILNNVIAGRICNTFDLQGVSYNLDADLNSHAASLGVVKKIIERHKGAVVLVAVEEELSPEGVVARKKLRAELFVSEEFARQNQLPLKARLNQIQFHGGDKHGSSFSTNPS